MKDQTKLPYEKPILTRLDGAAQGVALSCSIGSVALSCPKGAVVKAT